jgi:hypothetical protein
VDRQYLYGSFAHDVCGKYLTVFADFKYARTFFDSGLAPVPFIPDVFSDANRPFGISNVRGISVPLQNPFNPFTTPDYVSPGGFDPRFPETPDQAQRPNSGRSAPELLMGSAPDERALQGNPGRARTENDLQLAIESDPRNG